MRYGDIVSQVTTDVLHEVVAAKDVVPEHLCVSGEVVAKDRLDNALVDLVPRGHVDQGRRHLAGRWRGRRGGYCEHWNEN